MKKQSNERNPRSGSAFQAIRAIDYTVIFVRDMAAMRRFYEDVLGFPLRRELSPGWIEYRVGDNTLALARPRLTAADVPTAALASICSHRPLTRSLDIARYSSVIRMAICWRCLRRFRRLHLAP